MGSYVHIMLIMSTVLSFFIDLYNFDRSIEIELRTAEKLVIAHSVVFLAWQIIHYWLGCYLINYCDKSDYPALAVLELLQAYLMCAFHHNIFITEQRERAEQILQMFPCTKVSIEYSSSHFIIFSILTFFPLWFNGLPKAGLTEARVKEYKKVVFGVTYKTYETTVSWIASITLAILLVSYLLELFVGMNKTEKFVETDKKAVLVVGFVLFVPIQVVIFAFLIAQVISILMFLFNPFLHNLIQSSRSVVFVYKFTFLIEFFAFPIFICLMLLKSYACYQMSRTADYKTELENILFYQRKVKFHGVKYETWAYILFYLQMFSTFIVPVTWWFEDNREPSVLFDLVNQNLVWKEWITYSLLYFFVWHQISHTLFFRSLMFAPLNSAIVIAVQIVQLICFLLFWFNTFFSHFQNLKERLAVNCPYTSKALTVSTTGFICTMIMIIVLMYEKDDDPDTELVNKYEILDGEIESSTKKEHHEHPLYWLKKPEEEQKKKRKMIKINFL
ncbi:unnamed protein product [Caenorhabditis brenneri]